MPLPKGPYQAEFERRLSQLLAHCSLRIVSGYRPRAEQERLWQDALRRYGSPQRARRWVAPPGTSRHERGIAADLAGDLACAHAQARRYGLYFPMSWEPWHIELAPWPPETPKREVRETMRRTFDLSKGESFNGHIYTGRDVWLHLWTTGATVRVHVALYRWGARLYDPASVVWAEWRTITNAQTLKLSDRVMEGEYLLNVWSPEGAVSGDVED